MIANVNGIDVHYVIDGNPDKPWLTMVTGITNDTTMWDGQIDTLKNDFHILRYDLRGQGKTSSTKGPYKVQLLCEDLIALWDFLEIKQSNLMGLGLGGSICLAMGITHSDRIIKLVPCCCRCGMACLIKSNVMVLKLLWRTLPNVGSQIVLKLHSLKN